MNIGQSPRFSHALICPQIGSQDPIFGVQSVELKDAYTDDMFSLFSLWDSNKEEINLFIKQPNKFPS